MKKKALIISCFNWYQPRLEPVRQLLLNKYDVTVLIADFDHIKKQKIDKKYLECTYLKVPEYKKNLSLSRIRSHLVFGKKVAHYLKKVHPDLIFLQIPPNNIARYCLRYKRENPGIKYYIDLIDLWPESMPLRGLEKSILLGYWRKMRNSSLKAANHVFLECQLYEKKLRKVLIPEKTSVLYLFKRQTKEEKALIEELAVRKRKEKGDNILSFAYLGSINNIIDITGICNVLKSVITKGITVYVEIIGDGEEKENFIERLQATGANVVYHGAIYDQLKKIKILGQCDYGFNMMKHEVSVGLTIKSIDYFSMGIPIVNNIRGDTWEMVEKYNVGINYDFVNDNVDNLTKSDIGKQKYNAIVLYNKLFTQKQYETQIRKYINVV